MGSTKACSKCGAEKDLSEFGKDARAKDGLKGWCKTCRSAYQCEKQYKQQLLVLPNGEIVTRGALENRLRRSTPEGRQKTCEASVKYFSQSAWHKLRQKLGQETGRLLKQIGKGRSKDATIFAHFGATREEVFAYIDKQLQERGFSWENHGVEWVADHWTPLAIAQDSNELLRLCHLSNLQVMTPAENQAKGKLDRRRIRQHEAGV